MYSRFKIRNELELFHLSTTCTHHMYDPMYNLYVQIICVYNQMYTKSYADYHMYVQIICKIKCTDNVNKSSVQSNVRKSYVRNICTIIRTKYAYKSYVQILYTIICTISLTFDIIEWALYYRSLLI